MGLPVIWTFDLDNLISPDKNFSEIKGPKPPEKPKDAGYEIIPENLKLYRDEWISVNDWITGNGLYDFDENGNPTKFKNINSGDIGTMVTNLMTNVYELYSAKSKVYVDGSKPHEAQIVIITTNIITSVPPELNITNYITNIVNNFIQNPTQAQKDIQNKYNINLLRETFNSKYHINLKPYEGIVR